MPTQLLIYETVMPLSIGRHSDCSVEISGDYAFSGKVNSVPLMAVEFPHAASEYAIVFAGNETNLLPAVILGVRGNENLFLSKEKAWEAKYIPAFVRRYPFVFSTSPDGQRLILCIDEAFAGFNREGRGQRLFGEDGKPSAYVENVLKFLQEYQAQFLRTQAFCAKVRELDVLEPMQAQVDLASGERMALSGFMAVSRSKLKAVSGDKLAELAQTDELELLYLHLQAMRNFLSLKDRLVESGKMADLAPATASNGNGRAAPEAAGGASGDDGAKLSGGNGANHAVAE
jgi:SapC